MLRIMPAYNKLMGQQPSLQANQTTTINQGNRYNPGSSPLQAQNSFGQGLQPQRYYDQQMLQPGVTYNSLQYLTQPAPNAFLAEQDRFNALTDTQRAHELGLDKPITATSLGQPPPLPANFRPHSGTMTLGSPHQSLLHKLLGLF